MRIHVVCSRPGADRILPRMARYLADGCGWTLGTSPDRSAELNYFHSYITWRQHHAGWHKTPVAACFSHKDVNNPTKAQWWEETAAEVDLRCVWAEKYAAILRPHGPTVIVSPPVERERFTIRPKRRSGKPVVGVSGYTYNDGRKGERLVKRLAESEVAKRLELRASGRGWPIPTRGYSWNQMPSFFQSLDVLLVPSFLEGACMPPLEALACGVKVVIPRGVGLLDELPDAPGIYRYQVGDFDGMVAQVQEAAFGPPVDRQRLRAVTAPYTVAKWCADHQAAFEESLYAVPAESPLPPWEGQSGVYMVAFGEPSRKCAVRAINSVHAHMPGLPVALVSSEPLGPEDVFVQQSDVDIGGRIAKLKMDELAPEEWRYVLYLDADTEVVGDLSFLFQVLQDGWELVICKDMAKYHTAARMQRPDNKDECDATWKLMGTREALQYNGGMMAFRRCDRTREFFGLWQREYQRWCKRDQAALLRAVHTYPLRLFVLCNQWNATTRYEPPVGELAILHHNTQARRWGGIVRGRTDSGEAWEAVRRWEREHGRG